MIVYKVTNTVNGKVYIGITTKTIEERKKAHINRYRFGYRNHLYTAFEKYGLDKFKWEVIDKAESLEELKQKEVYYIQLYDSYNNGYNSTLGGDFNPMETEKGVQNHIKKMRDPQLRKRQSETFKRKWATDPEFVARTLEGIRKVSQSKEYREKLRVASIGRKHTIQDLEKMRANNPNKIPVGMFDGDTLVKQFNSIGEASRWAVENLSVRTNNPRNARIPIMNCCKGKYEKAYGYKWKYLSG